MTAHPHAAAPPAATRTVGGALEAAAARLRRAGVEAPVREARLLMAAALDRSETEVSAYPERALDDAAAARFDAVADARAARMPLSRILGRREFWSLQLRIGPAVLDPRPETETLVEAVLARVGDRRRKLRVLDLGTGSGCLLLALLHELPAATGVGIERDPAAAEIARANARDLGLAGRAEIRAVGWDAFDEAGLDGAGLDGAGLDGAGSDGAGFDAVVCNPPYVPSAEIERLAPEVARHDPRGALDGGPDGLDAYRALAPRLPRWLAPRGLAVLEVGRGQGEAVARLLAAAGLRTHPPLCDLAGTARCVPAEPAGRGARSGARRHDEAAGPA